MITRQFYEAVIHYLLFSVVPDNEEDRGDIVG